MSIAVNTVLKGSSSDGRVRKKSKTTIGEEYAASIRATKNLPAECCLSDEQLVKLQEHFKLLPQRYAVDVNTNGFDPLFHFLLLERARAQPDAMHFSIKLLDQLRPDYDECSRAFGIRNDILKDSPPSSSPEGAPPLLMTANAPAFQIGTPQSYGNLQELEAVEVLKDKQREFEVTFATRDGRGIMAFLTQVFTKLELNQKEVHCFPVADQYVLDVFILNSWEGEKDALERALRERLSQWQPSEKGRASVDDSLDRKSALSASDLNNSDWSLDMTQLKFGRHLAKGAFGDLYHGTYHGTEVAIKEIRDSPDSPQYFQEFLQEVAMMRKARHKNIVQMIGAHFGTDKKLIVFEYMSGGSVHDWIRRQPEVPVSTVLEIAIGVATGMAYLHSMNIIHRDLKAANLLIDHEHRIVKVSDFGVARLIDEVNIMTSETGTYRWMAPEVIAHRQYNGKADVYSFGILLWELITRKTPYEGLSPIQAAVGVVQENLRPEIPKNIHSRLSKLMESCWDSDPDLRPTFTDLVGSLRHIHAGYKEQEAKAGVQSLSLADEASKPIPIGSNQQGFLSKVFKGGGKR